MVELGLIGEEEQGGGEERERERERMRRFDETHGGMWLPSRHTPGINVATLMSNVYQRHLFGETGSLRELLSRNEKGQEDVRCVWVRIRDR